MTTSATWLLALAATALGASVDLRQETADCGNHTIAVGASIVVQSPNFPQKYPANERCVWEISCPNEDDNFLEFICPKFALEYSPFCIFDRLVVTSRGQKRVFCGTNSPNGTLTATGWAHLDFYSDQFITAEGFSCYVWCRAKPTQAPDTTTTTDAPTATTTTDAPTATFTTPAAPPTTTTGDGSEPL